MDVANRAPNLKGSLLKNLIFITALSGNDDPIVLSADKLVAQILS